MIYKNINLSNRGRIWVGFQVCQLFNAFQLDQGDLRWAVEPDRHHGAACAHMSVALHGALLPDAPTQPARAVGIEQYRAYERQADLPAVRMAA